MAAREVQVRTVERRCAGADSDELHVRRQHFLERTERDFNAFLLRQPADAAKQRQAGIDWQAELLLQFQLVGRLAAQVRRGVWMLKIRIGEDAKSTRLNYS